MQSSAGSLSATSSFVPPSGEGLPPHVGEASTPMSTERQGLREVTSEGRRRIVKRLADDALGNYVSEADAVALLAALSARLVERWPGLMADERSDRDREPDCRCSAVFPILDGLRVDPSMHSAECGGIGCTL